MASIHRTRKSRFWHCSYFDAQAGKWRLRSTGSAEKPEAQSICLRFEALARAGGDHEQTIPAGDKGEFIEAGLKLIQIANKGELGEAAAREFVNRVLKAAGQEPIEGATVGSFLDNWISGKGLSRSVHTVQRYKTTIELFKKSLGKRAKVSISSITARDVESFRDKRIKAVLPITAAEDVKILRAAFNVARRQGLIHSNPAEAVELPAGESKSREAFSADEVKLLIAATQDEEWKTAILFGFYAGLRLGDAVTLEWSNVDLPNSLLRYRAGKTKRHEEIPIHKILKLHLERIKGNAKNKICPSLVKQSISGRSGLSRRFGEIVAAAGIDAMTQDRSDGSGRRFSGKTFHSLRHGFISALANAGIAPELRQKLSGHNDADVHKKYTHLELDTLRTAIDSIKS